MAVLNEDVERNLRTCRDKECDEEPCKEVILKPLEDEGDEEEKEKEEQSKGEKTSATMEETNDRLTMPQNCVVQPLLTGTFHAVL